MPKLRSLVKSIIHGCNRCKQDRVKRLQPPATGDLPDFRSQFTRPFAATGVDFAGPLQCKGEQGEIQKVYIALFTCAATRAVHLELCKDLTALEFQLALKSFIARRGTPSLMVSDNAKTFQATAKWVDRLKEDHDVVDFLNRQQIGWRFNLSRAPWWGGFFERLVGIMKRALSKSVGKALLAFDELREALIDVEVFMNNRPLMYMGEECDEPVLTPNILLNNSSAQFLEMDLERLHHTDEETMVTRRMKYLQRTRDQLRQRFRVEYIHSLQERHKQTGSSDTLPLDTVVLMTDSLTDRRPDWRLARVVGHITGRDGVVRGLHLKLGNGYIIERPLELVRNLEIQSDAEAEANTGAEAEANADAEAEANTDAEAEANAEANADTDADAEVEAVGNPGPARPRRKAHREALDKLTGIFLNENEET